MNSRTCSTTNTSSDTDIENDRRRRRRHTRSISDSESSGVDELADFSDDVVAPSDDDNASLDLGASCNFGAAATTPPPSPVNDRPSERVLAIALRNSMLRRTTSPLTRMPSAAPAASPSRVHQSPSRTPPLKTTSPQHFDSPASPPLEQQSGAGALLHDEEIEANAAKQSPCSKRLRALAEMGDARCVAQAFERCQSFLVGQLANLQSQFDGSKRRGDTPFSCIGEAKRLRANLGSCVNAIKEHCGASTSASWATDAHMKSHPARLVQALAFEQEIHDKTNDAKFEVFASTYRTMLVESLQEFLKNIAKSEDETALQAMNRLRQSSQTMRDGPSQAPVIATDRLHKFYETVPACPTCKQSWESTNHSYFHAACVHAQCIECITKESRGRQGFFRCLECHSNSKPIFSVRKLDDGSLATRRLKL